MPYEAASSFYEVHLQGGSFDVSGAGLVGMPGITIGRNRHIAWGFTNNICSLRDLYLERPADVSDLRDETIAVRGADALRVQVRGTRRGPIIDELLPPVAGGSGPVAMRWAGVLPCDWTAAQLRLDRAESVAAAMDAMRGWRVPTFSVVVGDVDGHIGFLATGAVPIREVAERGYRPGDDPTQDWAGSIPHEGMPQVIDPAAGYTVTSNNRPAADDFPYPLSGTWDEGARAGRIGALIETATPGDVAAMGTIQGDTNVYRAPTTVAAFTAILDHLALNDGPPQAAESSAALAAWDGAATPDSRGAAIHEVLFTRWMQAVARERLGPELGALAWPWTGGLAAALLAGVDEEGWFATRARRDEVAGTVTAEAIAELAGLLGPDVDAWRWGRLHQLTLRHPLGGRGSLGELLDKPPVEVGGDPWTVNNSGYAGSPPGHADGRAFEAASGAGFRMLVDLGESPPRAWTVTAESQSAHPGSEHWADQVEDFAAGRYRAVPLEAGEVEAAAVERLVLLPAVERPAP